MDNRNRLVLGLRVTAPHDNAEVQARAACSTRRQRQGFAPDSLGADKGDCQRGFVQTLCRRRLKTHIATSEGMSAPRGPIRGIRKRQV